jgi:hypothetical protein
MAKNIAYLFQMIDGTGNAGELDGQISKEELKAFLERKNPDKSDAEIADKIDQVHPELKQIPFDAFFVVCNFAQMIFKRFQINFQCSSQFD